MSHTVQIPCLKQGAIDSNSWTSRVVTLDKRSGTLTISRRDRPSNVFYHAIQPRVVELWPHLSIDARSPETTSSELKRTILVLGSVTDVPVFAAENLAVVGIPLHHNALEHGFEPEVHSLATPHMLAAQPPSELPRPVHRGALDTWLLRFPSKASYYVAVQTLRGMEGVKFVGDR